MSRKVARLEEELLILRNTGPDTSTAVTLLQLQQQQQIQNGFSMSPSSPYVQGRLEYGNTGKASLLDFSSRPPIMQATAFIDKQLQTQPGGNIYPPTPSSSSSKRKRRDFELSFEDTTDVVSKGLISMTDAFSYFQKFFQGCVSSEVPVKQELI